MQEPGFWDDQERAAGVSAEHSRAQRKLDSYRTLESELDDLEALEELAEEDDSIAGELEETRAGVEERLAELEEQRLFSGPYDAGDAVMSVHAGTGGTHGRVCEKNESRSGIRFGSPYIGHGAADLFAHAGDWAGGRSCRLAGAGGDADSGTDADIHSQDHLDGGGGDSVDAMDRAKTLGVRDGDVWVDALNFCVVRERRDPA